MTVRAHYFAFRDLLQYTRHAVTLTHYPHAIDLLGTWQMIKVQSIGMLVVTAVNASASYL